MWSWNQVACSFQMQSVSLGLEWKFAFSLAEQMNKWPNSTSSPETVGCMCYRQEIIDFVYQERSILDKSYVCINWVNFVSVFLVCLKPQQSTTELQLQSLLFSLKISFYLMDWWNSVFVRVADLILSQGVFLWTLDVTKQCIFNTLESTFINGNHLVKKKIP